MRVMVIGWMAEVDALHVRFGGRTMVRVALIRACDGEAMFSGSVDSNTHRIFF